MTDIFEEVEEQLRSERYVQTFARLWPWLVGAAVAALLAALGWWGYQTWRDKQSAKASEIYASALDTLGQGDSNKAFSQLQTAAKQASGGYKALILMQEAGIRLDENKVQEAVALFDQAAKVSHDPTVADMARLKSALALLDTAPYPAMEERLKPLTDPKRPYASMAREALAMAKLKAGMLKEARADFVVLRLLPNAPDGVHRRASVAVDAIDSGAAAQVPAAVKAALAAPPPALTLPPGLQGLSGGPAQAGAAPQAETGQSGAGQ